MRLLFVVVLTLLHTAYAVAQEKRIYISRDANGVVIFSDSPTPDSEEISLTTRPNIMAPTEVRFPERKVKEEPPFGVEIIQPLDQATIRDNTGSVYIEGRITPRFQRGLRVRLLLDGKAYGEPQTNGTFILRNVDRGEHSIQLELLDENGKLIAVSSVSTFYLHRARVNSPN